jgi:uncharacterized cupin superfamily protein
VPLDDLVGAPEVGDPRVRLKPRRVSGRTIPLSGEPGGMQAWKILIPTSKSTPEPRTHEGREWLYVLAGRMRLALGDQDLVLRPGEVADFDTPHWFGSDGDAPAEILSLFGRHRERMHLHSATWAASRDSRKQQQDWRTERGPRTVTSMNDRTAGSSILGKSSLDRGGASTLSRLPSSKHPQHRASRPWSAPC